MPVGLLVMKWDDRVGTKIEAKYPEEINVMDSTLMQIYSTHEYSSEAGIISIMVGSLNIMSYYSGPDKRYYVVLLLSLDDDPDAYEAGLSDISRVILQNTENKEFVPMIPSLFQRISIFPSLNREQQLAVTYQDEIKRMIIERLREEGVVSKSELMIWLRDQYKHGFVDLDALMVDLIRKDIIKEASVKGMPSELLFFLNDILMTRRPPINLLKNPVEKGLPEKFVNEYEISIKNFFQDYKPSKEDNLELIKLVMDPQVYECLKLLRTMFPTKNELEKLKKKGVYDLDEALKALWENQMIVVFQKSKGIEYYALVSDFEISTFFPKYILNTIIKEYDVKSKADRVLIEFLNVLEEAYYSYKEMKKQQKKEKKALAEE